MVFFSVRTSGCGWVFLSHSRTRSPITINFAVKLSAFGGKKKIKSQSAAGAISLTLRENTFLLTVVPNIVRAQENRDLLISPFKPFRSRREH